MMPARAAGKRPSGFRGGDEFDPKELVSPPATFDCLELSGGD